MIVPLLDAQMAVQSSDQGSHSCARWVGRFCDDRLSCNP